jgi:hypothetical protein
LTHCLILIALSMPIGLVAFGISKIHSIAPPNLQTAIYVFGGCGVALLMGEASRLSPSTGSFAEFFTMSAAVLLTWALVAFIAIPKGIPLPESLVNETDET